MKIVFMAQPENKSKINRNRNKSHNATTEITTMRWHDDWNRLGGKKLSIQEE